MFPQIPFSFCNAIAFGVGSINATAKAANITSPLLGSSQFNATAGSGDAILTIIEPLLGTTLFDNTAQYANVESDILGDLPIPTFYSADFGFVINLYIDTTYILGTYIVSTGAVWQDDQIYEIPSSGTTSYSYSSPFTVTPDLADVDIGGDLYVDTGDRYWDYTITNVFDTATPCWTQQLQFSIRARWSFSSTDHFDYDLPRCADANIKIIPTFGTLTQQRRAFTLLESSVISDVLPSTDYTFVLQGDTMIDTRTITVDYPNITADSVNFNGDLRVLYLTEELAVTGTNIDAITLDPEKITAPLYWYWTSPTTTEDYDL